MVCLQQERLSSEIVGKMTDAVEGSVGFLLERVPAGSDTRKLLTSKPNRLMYDPKIIRSLLVDNSANCFI